MANRKPPAARVYPPSPIKEKRYRRTRAEIEKLREAIYDVIAEDNPMTVRQVFYQMVVRDVVPKSEAGYDVVQRQVLQMRRDQTVPFDWVSDNTRWMRKPRTFSSMNDALQSTARTYRRALWDDQDAYVEVWCEKDALAGVILEETRGWDVPLMVSRGFSSDSYLYECAMGIVQAGKPAFLYYFGDRDPSGVKIDPAVRRGLERLAPDADISFRRVAVTVEQIETLDLPTRPTKRGENSHAKDFEGDSVELDAIPAATLREMVRECIEAHIDPEALDRTRHVEALERESLVAIAERFGPHTHDDDE